MPIFSTFRGYAQRTSTPTDHRQQIERDLAERNILNHLESPTSSRDQNSSNDFRFARFRVENFTNHESSVLRRLNISMEGSQDSPASRISYSWGPEGDHDDPDSSANGPEAHTPKIMNRQQRESHLKAPTKEKVSQEEILYVSNTNSVLYFAGRILKLCVGI